MRDASAESRTSFVSSRSKNLGIRDPEQQHQAKKRAKRQQCCRCAGSHGLDYLPRNLKIVVPGRETCVFPPPAESPERKRRADQQNQDTETQKSILKSNMDNKTRITPRPITMPRGKRAQSLPRTADSSRRCTPDRPWREGGRPVARPVIDFRATESTHIGRYIDRLPTLRAFEDVEIFAWTIEVEPLGHSQTPPQVNGFFQGRMKSRPQ